MIFKGFHAFKIQIPKTASRPVGEKNHRRIQLTCIFFINLVKNITKNTKIQQFLFKKCHGDKIHRIGDKNHRSKGAALRILFGICLAFLYKGRMVYAQHLSRLSHGTLVLYGAQDYGLFISRDEIL